MLYYKSINIQVGNNIKYMKKNVNPLCIIIHYKDPEILNISPYNRLHKLFYSSYNQKAIIIKTNLYDNIQ